MDFENREKSKKNNSSGAKTSPLLPVFIGAATASLVAHPFEVCKIRNMLSESKDKFTSSKNINFTTLTKGLLENIGRNALVYAGGVYIGRSIWPIMGQDLNFTGIWRRWFS